VCLAAGREGRAGAAPLGINETGLGILMRKAGFCLVPVALTPHWVSDCRHGSFGSITYKGLSMVHLFLDALIMRSASIDIEHVDETYHARWSGLIVRGDSGGCVLSHLIILTGG
jgi:hypothetical protein